ncbi:restriction endonuclease subunit S [Mesorhizobium sp.]|uniref:restriction endonuclease subunit S n=1 Tax=Mesorhizobium sp. TaxID=1871066 RepID=UPI00257FF964|nr:restriction endonuclease subunit S [Mesorhizobium sp.]
MDMTVAPAEQEAGSGGWPWELPAGWCWTYLGELGAWTGGGTPSKANKSFWSNGTVPWVSPKDMKADIIGDTEDKITIDAVENSSAKYVRIASVLMVLRSGILRHSFPVAVTDRIVTLNQDLRALTPFEGIDPTFVARYLKFATKRVLEDCSKDGTTVNSIEVSALERLPFPLAPLPEQHRVVNRLDALFTEISEGEAALAEARKGLETFHRALLKAAVTGELTRDWREKNKPVKTGHDLLARIKAERAAQTSKGRRKRMQDTEPLNTTDLPELPEGWAWALVADVGSVQLGRQRAPQHHQGENMHPYLRVANVFENRIDLNDVKEMNFSPAELETFELTPGDILLNEGQTPDLLGRSAMWRSAERGFCFQNTLLRFRAIEPLEPEFCLLVFRHYLHAKRFKRESQITTNIAHLSSGRFSTIEFPVPPIEEQKEIVRLTQHGLASAADTRILLDSQLSDAARLHQAILKSAFEGTLVPQDPADEPASVVLAHLKAAPSRATIPRRGRKRAVRE